MVRQEGTDECRFDSCHPDEKGPPLETATPSFFNLLPHKSMNLIFHDASQAPPLDGAALLNIEHKGACSFTVAAVAQLKMSAGNKLIFVQDADTNTWFLLLSPPASYQGFELRKRDKNSQALMFHTTQRVKAYWQAHGLNGQKSVRTLVSATPIEHEGLRLYPLTPQHPTQAPNSSAPEQVAQASTVEEDVKPALTPEPEPATESEPTAKAGSKYTPEQDARLLDIANSPSDLAREWGVSAAALHTRRAQLKKKAGEVPALVEAPATPAAPQLVYTPATGGEPVKKTFGLQARAEELTTYWYEREIRNTKPNELAEILSLLRHVPSSKRGIEMQLVLDRAETEHAHRQLAAGKGGNRG